MAIQRYVLTATVTVPAGTAATPVAGEPSTGGVAGYGSVSTTGGPLWPVTYVKGTVIELDPAGQLYAAIGSGNLRAYVQGQDDVGHAALANLSVRTPADTRRQIAVTCADLGTSSHASASFRALRPKT